MFAKKYIGVKDNPICDRYELVHFFLRESESYVYQYGIRCIFYTSSAQ